MIKTIDIEGKKMLAVVLGDKWGEDAEEYRKALFEVLEAAVMNDEAMENSWFGGATLCTYIRLIRAFMGEEQQEQKGGKG